MLKSSKPGDIIVTSEEISERHGERLATLEREMRDLLGNGQPGRITLLERVILAHQRLIWVGMGIVITFQMLLVILHFFHVA